MLIRNVTVTVPATRLDLVTLQQVKRELGIDTAESESSDDTILQDMITGYSARIAKYCRRVFVKETVSEDQWPDSYRHRDHHYSHNLSGRSPGGLGETDQVIIVSRKPIISITSINIDDNSVDVNSGIRKSDNNGMIWKLNSGYTCGWNIYKLANIVYEAGYAINDVPSDIQRALIITVKENFQNSEQNQRLKLERVDGVGSWSYYDREDAFPPQAMDILEDWREAFHRD